MNILFASGHCCIRVIKEGHALLKKGHTVNFLQHKVINGDSMLAKLPWTTFYNSIDQYKEKIKTIEDIDIIHVHNEPDWIVYEAKEAKPDVPVVYDCHDLASISKRGDTNEERKAMEAADAYIFPSEGYMKCATENWALPDNKPKAVVYPMCLADTIVRKPLPRIPGICYEGGIIGSKHSVDSKTQNFHNMGATYRDHTELVKFLSDNGKLIGMYGIYPGIQPEYLKLGALCMGIVEYGEMLRQLSRYDWGFVGNTESHSALKYCMPNKLFEYVAAGIPVIVMNCEEAGAYVVDHDLGIYADSPEEVIERYGEHEKWRELLLNNRESLLMENEIEKVIDIYAQIKA